MNAMKGAGAYPPNSASSTERTAGTVTPRISILFRRPRSPDTREMWLGATRNKSAM